MKVPKVSLPWCMSFEYTLACHVSTILIYRCCEYYYQVWAGTKLPKMPKVKPCNPQPLNDLTTQLLSSFVVVSHEGS